MGRIGGLAAKSPRMKKQGPKRPAPPIVPPSDLLTDAELCARLRISKPTLRKHLRSGPPTKRHEGAGDLRTIRYVTIGGSRRWSRASVEEFLHGEPVKQ
jgi:hypothetical protein